MISMDNKNTLTTIENANIEAVQATLNKIVKFQNIVKKTLKENLDYGIIPGCKKPSLLKPGAEKITMLMGLKTKFEIVSQQQDIEKGFFRYQVKAQLIKCDEVITEGFGSANTKESKYAKSGKNAFTLDNTVLKMAKKRSLVDAVLLVASLSEIFTQDVEDLDDKKSNGNSNATDNTTGKNNVSNLDQEILAKIKNILFLASGKNENKALDLLEKHTAFTGSRDGKQVPGLREYNKLTNGRLKATYGKLKEIYPEIYNTVKEKMKKRKEAS